MKQRRTEYTNVRMTPSEKRVLYRLAGKEGSLSAAVRFLVQQHADKRKDSTNVKSADTFHGDGALQTN